MNHVSETLSLESLLTEVRQYVVPAKEPTLFAVGGRGYYENPASDLLAFFLKPDAKHGLGNLFLSTFLELIGVDHRALKMSYVDVEREVETNDGSRIDLQILGLDWCILIENKIRHRDANPFASYEAHAKRLRKKTIFAILSPDGHMANGWIGVSYQAYFQALREKMPVIFSDPPLSKWHLFAREFILHLENELYNPPMTPEKVAFVEKHADQIAEVQKLAAQYRLFVLEELKQRLESSVSGHIFDTRDEGWAYRCRSPQWGESDVVLIKPEGTGQKFLIRVYLEDMSEPRLSNARRVLDHMRPEIDGQYPYWTSRTGYDSSEEAIAELCKLAQIVSGLLKK
jgi:hypothetical protein